MDENTVRLALSLIRRRKRQKLGQKRIVNILGSYAVANARTLENKISDAGPNNQRIDPHILTDALKTLIRQGLVVRLKRSIPWYHLTEADQSLVNGRLNKLSTLHRKITTGRFSALLGQPLEIAVFRALNSQSNLSFFGNFQDLTSHDDSSLYSKTEPPSDLNGRVLPKKKKLDFLVHSEQGGYAGVEIKNIREWIYPSREELRDLFSKCCTLDVVPVLIARRIHYSTFSVLNPCGVILHETYNQRYPSASERLADEVKDKNSLGYHDVRVGNQPDARLTKFIHIHLHDIIGEAREKFDKFKDLLAEYADGTHSYKSFSARVKRRTKGEPEDLPPEEE